MEDTDRVVVVSFFPKKPRDEKDGPWNRSKHFLKPLHAIDKPNMDTCVEIVSHPRDRIDRWLGAPTTRLVCCRRSQSAAGDGSIVSDSSLVLI